MSKNPQNNLIESNYHFNESSHIVWFNNSEVNEVNACKLITKTYVRPFYIKLIFLQINQLEHVWQQQKQLRQKQQQALENKVQLTFSCLKKYRQESALSTKNLLDHLATLPVPESGKTERLSFQRYPS